MFISPKADFFSLAVVYVAIPLLSQRFLNATLKSVPLSEQTFCGCTSSIIFSNALAASRALFDRFGTTRKNLENTSRANRKYLTSLLYSANLSTEATSIDQILLICKQSL